MGKKSYILYFTQTYLLTLQPYYERYNTALSRICSFKCFCAANKGCCN